MLVYTFLNLNTCIPDVPSLLNPEPRYNQTGLSPINSSGYVQLSAQTMTGSTPVLRKQRLFFRLISCGVF